MNKVLIYSLAAIEGMNLMAVELISSRIIAPGFGTSLSVWAVILSLTLISLTVGYYFGGKLSLKEEKQKSYLFFLFSFLVLVLFFYPFIGKILVDELVSLNLILGLSLSSIFLIVVPVTCFGMVTPLLISLIAKNDVEKAGNFSGKIYGISTFGGVFATFLFGLYSIPYWGVNSSCMILSASYLIAFLGLKLLK